MKLIAGLVLLTFFTVSKADVARGLGECPDGHKPGDVWYPPGCVEYNCDAEGYTIYGCGVYDIEYDKTRCYEQVDASAKYPGCCEPKVICKGDPGFDKSKLEPQTKKPNPTTKPTPKTTRKPTTKKTPKTTRKSAQKPKKN
ncbi:hypothetical protein Btru_033834 [Bulinus truncatus]|nr:hypothetical protein Btru_033834 [Bulinus truncatus]